MNQDQIKGIMEILGLSIMEIDNRQRRQEKFGEIVKVSLENLNRGFHSVEEEFRSREIQFQEATRMI